MSTKIDSLVRLQEIATLYREWSDPCSCTLHNWIEETIIDPSQLQARINLLFQELLLNPLFPEVPLQDPWLEGKTWVWEKSMYDAWPDLPSPLDGKPLEEIEEHSFAKALMSWARPLQEIKTTSTALIVPTKMSTQQALCCCLHGKNWAETQEEYEQQARLRAVRRDTQNRINSHESFLQKFATRELSAPDSTAYQKLVETSLLDKEEKIRMAKAKSEQLERDHAKEELLSKELEEKLKRFQ